MKSNLVCLLCISALLASTGPALADEPGAGAIAVDALVGRPACFAATVIGSVLFVIALPVAATSRSVKKTAHALVVKPARATFTRPLGDFDSLSD